MIINVFWVICALIFCFFIGGYVLLRFLIIEIGYEFNQIETLVFSILLGIPIIYIVSIILNKIGLELTNLNLLASFVIMIGSLTIFLKKIHLKESSHKGGSLDISFILIFILSLVITMIPLINNPLPYATDLSNHVYYIREVFFTHNLPNFHLPVFVIGETLIIAIPSIIFSIDPLSIFPIVILFLFRMVTIVLVYLLANRIFKSRVISLLAMLSIGMLYSFQRPGTIFVYGGVIGNIVGDALILASLYMLYRTIYDSEKYFLFFVLFFFSIVYTHTLSLLITSSMIMSFLILLIIFDKKNILYRIKTIAQFIKNKYFLALLIILSMTLFLYLPSYISKEALRGATIDPIMEVPKQKLTVDFFKEIVGPFRFSFAMLGLVMLVFSREDKSIKLFFIGWLTAIFLLSWDAIKFINLPQSRIVNYMVYPSSVLMVYPLKYFRSYKSWRDILIVSLFVTLIIVIGSSLPERALKEDMPRENILSLYHASLYLKNVIKKDETVLSEHVNSGFPDTWTKVFLLDGYNKVLERVYYFRYKDDPIKETWVMMENPNSEEGVEYMQKNNVSYIIQNTEEINKEFLGSNNFFTVYQGGIITIFKKNEKTQN